VPARSRPRIGVVLRPCELRALVELAKLQQANLADLLTIGVDCPGTYDVPTYSRCGRPGARRAEMFAGARTGELAPQPDYTLRDACLMCERPQVEGATCQSGCLAPI